MADAKVEGEELKKLIRMGKKRQMNFAFCPGPKNDHLMVIDRRKKPEVIGKVAKKEGAGSKVAFGSYVLNSKTLELTCERVVPAMAKILKKYLKSQKVLVNVLIMDMDGNVLDRDAEDLPDDPSLADDDTTAQDPEDDQDGDDAAKADDTGPAEADDAEPRPVASELVQRVKAVQSAIAAAGGASGGTLKKAVVLAVSQIKADDLVAAEKTLTALETAVAKLDQAAKNQPQERPQEESKADADPAQPDATALTAQAKSLRDAIGAINGPAGETLAKALAKAARLLQSGDLPTAAALMARIETGIDREAGNGQSPASPEAAKWASAEARLQPLVDKMMQERRGDLATVNRFFDYAKDQAAAGNFDKAMAAASRIANLVNQAETETTTAAARAAQEAVPDNVVAYTKTRLAWIKTRSGLRQELQGLKSAIDTATAGLDGMEQVPAKSAVLFDYLDDIDGTLEDTLEQLVEAPDGDQRQSLKTAARKIIDEYRGVLDTKFFQAVDDNGFVATSIRADALSSLQEVSAALDA